MKAKLVLAALALTLSLPTIAQHRHGGHGWGHHHHHGHRHNWVAPLVGGLIIGGVLSQAARAEPAPVIITPTDPSIYNPPVVTSPVPPLPGCRQVYMLHRDMYGSQYYAPVTVCN